MRLRSRIATAPWPIWFLVFAGTYALSIWPLLLDPEPAMFGGLCAGTFGLVMGRVLGDSERRSLTGWDRMQRHRVFESARRGTLPDTARDRATLRLLVEKDLREHRGLAWLLPVSLVAVIFLTVRQIGDDSTLWTAVAVAWYALVGVLVTRLQVRDRAGLRALHARLDAAGVEPQPEPRRRDEPTHRLEDLLD